MTQIHVSLKTTQTGLEPAHRSGRIPQISNLPSYQLDITASKKGVGEIRTREAKPSHCFADRGLNPLDYYTIIRLEGLEPSTKALEGLCSNSIEL